MNIFSPLQVFNLPVADTVWQWQTQNQALADFIRHEFVLLRSESQTNSTLNLDTTTKGSYLRVAKKYQQKGLTKERILTFHATAQMEIQLQKLGYLFLHGASIINQKKMAVLVLGESGAGKTTLISRFPKALRLSNDTIILKRINRQYYCFYSPFDKIYLDFKRGKKFLVREIFVLKQAKSDRIKVLTASQKLRVLLKNDYLAMNLRILKRTQTDYTYLKQLPQSLMQLISSVPITGLEVTKNFPLKLLNSRPSHD